MDIRKMMLPEGWYPHSYRSAEMMINRWKVTNQKETGKAASGIGPHAGWYYSGKLSWRLVSCIPEDTELIIIAGGHLLPGENHRVFNFSRFETPFGSLSLDQNIKNCLCSDFNDDREIDNTVEIYLPLIKFAFPDVQILPVRLSPDMSASVWGGKCSEYCIKNNLKAFFIGSTDLSHYGKRFNNTIYGLGKMAKEKVHKNDFDFLQKLTHYELSEALDEINETGCACSGGAALGAGSFSKKLGKTEAKILDHFYSYDIAEEDDSFVGYGAVVYL